MPTSKLTFLNYKPSKRGETTKKNVCYHSSSPNVNFQPISTNKQNNNLNADISNFVFFISFKQQKVSCGSLTLLFIKIRTLFHQVSLVQHTLEFHTQETLGFSPQWLSQNQLTSKTSCYLNNLQPRDAKRNIFYTIKINLRNLPSIIELLLYPNELPTTNNNNNKENSSKIKKL